MIRALYTAISGLITEECKQQEISNNLANANTTGYKKQDLRCKDFKEALMINYDKVVSGKNTKQILGHLSQGSKIDDVVVKYTQGPIINTGKKTDFAIDGSGFFVVRDKNGKNLYTRDGQFKIGIYGDLITNNGCKVLGFNVLTNNLEPIKVQNGKIQCDEDGNIKINGKTSYKFAIASFNRNQIKNLTDNLYISTAKPRYINSHIKQQCIERSNVNIINEMVDLMTTMRNFESNQKVVQTVDDTLEKLINKVGEVR